MSAAKRSLVLLVVAGALMGVVLTQLAAASHPRPKSASPVRVPLVPAYEACVGANRQHGPPLAFPSCNPPVQSSGFLTVGTPDANGAAASSNGYLKVVVAPTTNSDLTISLQVTDVRCKPSTSSGCGATNAVGGRDYTGDLRANATIRITDHWNATGPGGGSDPATVVDIPFPINLQCGSTADTSIGSTCTVNASEVSVGPPGPTVIRAVVEISQFEVSDGGADGVVVTSPNTTLLRQGLFIP
jgi:hypothetical protein